MTILEKIREFIKQAKEGMSYIPEPYCGPFHPEFVDTLKKENLHCPQCGTLAKEHS